MSHYFAAFSRWLLLTLLLWSAVALAMPASAQVGTWTATTASPVSLETALLLTDGTVICHSFGDYTVWYKLTPDAQGNYADGAWTQIASNAVGRLYGQTAVLRDGRVFYGGGEYLSGTGNHNTCEIYDPVANVWTFGPDSLYDSLGDTGSAILPDGRLLCSNWSNTSTDIYNPVTNTWANAVPMMNDSGDEETWITLADGSILNTFRIGQRYLASLNAWQATGAIPVSLVDSASEMGPALELYDGRVLALGATGHTAFFTPPAILTDPGSWVAGPDMPNGLSAPDTPACVEVNGKVLCIGTPTDFAATTFLEFDPATNLFTSVPSPAGFSQDSYSYVVRMLALPNGQVLMTADSPNAWVYTPVSGPQPAWAPAVGSVAANNDGTYTVSGTQLNGLTNGASYGDEANPYTHYPIVYLVDGAGNVHYARTFNFSQMNPSQPGAHQTADFTLPPGLTNGAYSLHVSASGVSSAAYPLQIGQTTIPTIINVANASGTAGQTVTLSATLTLGGGSMGISGKTLTFQVDTNPVLSAVTNSSGVASVSYPLPAATSAGSHTITVTFAGDSTDGASSGSGTLTVTADVAANLAFLQQPTTTPAGANIQPAVVVQATDASNNPVFGVSVTLTLQPASGALSGTVTRVTDSSGKAIFESLRVNNAGQYTLTATAGSLSVTSATFTVTTPTQVTVSNVSGAPGQTVTLSATLTTTGGTALSSKTLTFQAGGPATALVNVGTSVTNSAGVASVSYLIPATATVGSNIAIIVSFAGDNTDGPSSGTGTLTVTAPPAGQVRFWPRTGFTQRMVGGQFQASHDNANWTALATVTQNPPAGQYTTLPTTQDPAPFRFLRYLAPNGSYGDVAEIEFDSNGQKLTGTGFGTPGSYHNDGTTFLNALDGNPATFFDGTTPSGDFVGIDQGGTAPTYTKLTGTVFGTAGSYHNDGTTIANAFDGSLATFFDGPGPNGDYAGLDLGSGHGSVVTRLQYCPRSGFGSRMVGGVFQGSNDNATWTALFTVTSAPAVGVLTQTTSIGSGVSYRYLRYLAPNNSYGDVAEIEFDTSP